MRVLNQFFWLRLSAPFFPPHRHVFNKVVKNSVKKEKKDDEKNETGHDRFPLIEDREVQIADCKILNLRFEIKVF